MSSPTDTIDISIGAQLSRVAEGSPATILIRVLLHHFAVHNVARFIRNAQSWNQIYYKSRLVYDSIQELVEQLHNSNGSAEVMTLWKTFQLYSAAIILLEKILLNFYYRHRPHDQQELLPPTDGIDLTIIYIETWEDDRKELETTFETFSSNDSFLNLSDSLQKNLADNYKVHRTADDLQTLKALFEFFATLNLTDKNIIRSDNQRLVADVKASLNTIIEKLSHIPTALATNEIVIQILLLIYVPFAYLSVETTSSEWRDFFRSTQIWEVLQRLAKDTESHLQANSAITVVDLEKRREEFIILLLRLSDVDNGKQILYLLKLAAHIRGPLRARSVELVKMIFKLNESVKDEKRRNLLHHARSDLTKLLAESIATLEGAKEAVIDIKRITLVSDEYRKQESKLNDILGKIALTYSTVGLRNEWLGNQDLFNAAVKIDQDHLTLLREQLNVV